MRGLKGEKQMKEDMNKIIDSLNENCNDFTEEEDLYDLEVMRQYMKDKKAGKIKSYPIELLYKELGL